MVIKTVFRFLVKSSNHVCPVDHISICDSCSLCHIEYPSAKCFLLTCLQKCNVCRCRLSLPAGGEHSACRSHHPQGLQIAKCIFFLRRDRMTRADTLLCLYLTTFFSLITRELKMQQNPHFLQHHPVLFKLMLFSHYHSFTNDMGIDGAFSKPLKTNLSLCV